MFRSLETQYISEILIFFNIYLAQMGGNLKQV